MTKQGMDWLAEIVDDSGTHRVNGFRHFGQRDWTLLVEDMATSETTWIGSPMEWRELIVAGLFS